MLVKTQVSHLCREHTVPNLCATERVSWTPGSTAVYGLRKQARSVGGAAVASVRLVGRTISA